MNITLRRVLITLLLTSIGYLVTHVPPFSRSILTEGLKAKEPVTSESTLGYE